MFSVDGTWGAWSALGCCGVTCGNDNGDVSRRRNCDNPLFSESCILRYYSKYNKLIYNMAFLLSTCIYMHIHIIRLNYFN